jgi:hypothetical protein
MRERERDESYPADIANRRPIGTTRAHCDEDPSGGWRTSPRDLQDGERPEVDQCAEFNRRLRSGIGAGSNPNLR